MPLRLGATLTDSALKTLIREVRSRWRLKNVLKGLAMVLGTGIAVFALSAYGMDYFRFGPASIIVFRVLTYAALAVLAWRYLVRPLRHRVSDERVALYIEEHEPELQGEIVSAVEIEGRGDRPNEPSGSSPLSRRVIERAIEKCVAIDYGRSIERRGLYHAYGLFAGAMAAGLAAIIASPAFLRHAAPLIVFPWTSARAASVYSIDVSPGSITLARGADQQITATLLGFDAEQVEIVTQTGEAGKWERWPMHLDDASGSHLFMLLDLDEQTEYFVEASGVRSVVHRIDVADLPYVDRIDLEYRFPAYTGLSPQRQEDGGDIAALRGTRVLLRITPTIPVSNGRILIEGAEPINLTAEGDSVLSGALRVARSSFYHIELESPEGVLVPASPEYAIDVLSDQPPSVSFSKPGRDTRVSSIEEVFAEARVEDDFGVKALALVYSVNGGAEQSVELYSAARGRQRDLTAGHTFFLEEFELEPGDLVAYFARASDTRDQTASTDMYFLDVRPFGKEYRQADQRGQMGGGGGAGSALSGRQREIIVATFKMVRDRDTYPETEYQENLNTLVQAQRGIRQQVLALVQRMKNRGVVETDSGFRRIIESFPLAAAEMELAEQKLSERKPDEALAPEQRALAHLQRAEAVFREVRVGSGNAGGTGGWDSNAEDLADLFELELDKLRNQYETVQRGERQVTNNLIDETLARLKELARRQEQHNERLRRRARLEGAPGGTPAAQRELAEETEELARRLERLARERSSPELANTARRLKDAAQAMRRSAADGAERGMGEGISALDRLADARRLLEKNQTERIEDGLTDAIRQARRVAELQDKIEDDVQDLRPVGQNTPDQMRRLLERKDQLAGQVADLEGQLDQMARDVSREQREASRKLREAANSIRQTKLKEKIRYSKGIVAGRSPEYAREFEGQISSDIDSLQQRLADAKDAVGQNPEDNLAGALERTRQAVRGLESLEERIRERRLAGQRGQDDQAGRQGQQGSENTEAQGGNGGAGEQSPSGRGAADGAVNDGGALAPGGNGSRLAPGRLSPSDIRQFRREIRERRNDIEGLRRDLRREGVEVADIDEVIQRLRALDSQRVYDDPLEFERLQRLALDGLKQFEYALRREIDGADRERLFLSGSDEVPAGYREMVEEYYRSLSRE